jgi:hypothetical protein
MRKNFLVNGGLRYDFSGSQAAFCKHFNGRCTVGSREMITKGQLQVEGNNFIEASRNLSLLVDSKASTIFKTHQSIYRKCIFSIIGHRKIFNSRPNPFW